MTEQITTDAEHRLEFIIGDEAWYAPANRRIDPYISVMKNAAAGGCAWEFVIVDRSRTIERQAIQVKVFDEAFPAFVEFTPLFTALAVEQPNTLDGVRAILERLGFADITPRERANA